jgi:hypothetical protein
MGKRNPVAQVLRTPKFRPTKIGAVKGKGSYTRKKRHRLARPDGVFFVLPLHASPRAIDTPRLQLWHKAAISCFNRGIEAV